ncbi:2-phospho-L-lactate guanylyltransferase [Actinopolymorpha sp. B11F2]|uniref:2-phospho-L-lactate guanylyltransferase n=1 Tax=Actinopolymorpha sp. B11F2 TaxID=3160862 RepID=UPI0032E46C56
MSSLERANGSGSSPDHRGGAGWTLVVPVKPATVGKSRLAPFAGEHRTDLARAMALDTVTAAMACPVVVDVLAVTHDHESGAALSAIGAIVISDEPEEGLNAALRHGAARARARRPGCAVAAMLGDLPALRPDELAPVLDAALAHPTSFVADADAVGTTLYCAAGAAEFAPRFGGASRAAHLASGAVELDLPAMTSVRRDVDTEADLMDALTLGVGARTRAAVALLL